MLFWILSAILTAGVVLALTRPLSRHVGHADAEARAADLEVYRDQLREIEGDVGRGLITPAEAEAARIEVSRRILALGDGVQPPAAPAPSATPLLGRTSYAIAIAVPLIAILSYIGLGSPGLPSRPYAERVSAPIAGNPSLDVLIGRVEARLREHPDDGQGWEVIAPIYLRLERFEDAAFAYGRAVALQGESSRRLAGLGEAKVMAASGVVTDDARKIFQRLLELEPGRPDARFWLAMAKEQDGDIAAAVADYRALVAAAPGDAAWLEMVEMRLSALGAQSSPGGEARSRPGSPPAVPSGAEEQRRMIEAMVAGLAERLRQDGSDVAGWQRLLQSYTVLGRRDAAATALAEARVALAGDAKGLGEIEAFASGLGIAAAPARK